MPTHTVFFNIETLNAGYGMAVFNSEDYPMYSEAESVWIKLAALRDAMDQYPHSQWFWYLDQVFPLRVI